MMSNGDLDPDWYGAPASTLMTGMAALYAAYGFAGILLGNLGSMADIVPAYQADGTYFLLSGRIYTAIAATAVVVATYAVTRELRVSHFWSGLAALVIALSPLMIGYSWLVRMDMFQVLFMLLALLMVLRALRKPTLTAFVLAGVFVGLGVASKYPAVVVAIPILAAAIVLAGQGRLSIRASIGYLVSAGVASLIAAAVVAPYLFIDFEEVLAHVERENRSTHLGHTGQGFFTDLWDYLNVALPQALKGPGTLLGIIGLGSMLASRRGWLLPLAFAIYLLFISYLSLWWVRWALPLVPLAAIGAVFLAHRLELRLRPRLPAFVTYGARIAVAALLLVPVAIPTAEMVWSRATTDDVRVEAAKWMDANIPAGSTLVIESYVPQVLAEEYECSSRSMVRSSAGRSSAIRSGRPGSSAHWAMARAT